MFFKSIEMEVKADQEKRTFEGYASKYGNIDLHGDIITQGAFTDTINERMPKKAIKILWQHAHPIGMPTEFEDREDGLYVKGRLSKTQQADEAIELMNDRVVDGMSIGYDVEEDDFDQEHNIRYLKRLKLYEVSIVTWGANPEALITNVSNIKQLEAINDIFKDDTLKRLGEVKTLLDQLNDTLDSETFQVKDGNIIVNADELKAGRVLSKKNKDNLTNAVNLIQEVLKTTDEEVQDDVKKLEEDLEFKELLNDIRSYARK